MEWLVNLVHREAPVRRPVPPAVQARKDDLLALWSRYVEPVAEGGEGDYEDFYEQAFRLEAALDAFGPDNVWLTIHNSETAVNAGTGERRPAASLEHLPRYGAQPSRRHQFVAQPQALLADNYWRYEAFRSRAGRRIEVCGFNPDDGSRDIRTVLAGFAADGIGRAFVKANLNKFAAFPMDLPQGAGANEIRALLSDELEWSLIYLEGAPNIFQAQEFVAMEYEYRVFVVGQEAVTAAGCIEEYTPLDNTGDAFDNRLRRHRSKKSPVEEQPQVADVLLRFAREVIGDLAREVPDLTDYVVDVALGPDGNPLVVELTPLLNSGLYASRPELVTSAMVPAM